jgi:hypothetical protein
MFWTMRTSAGATTTTAADGSPKPTNAANAERFDDARRRTSMPIAMTARAAPTKTTPAGNPATAGGLAVTGSIDPGNATSSKEEDPQREQAQVRPGVKDASASTLSLDET